MTTNDARIIPVFRYKDAHAAIDWLGRAFGFVRHEVFEGSDGTIGHAELRLNGDAIAISSAGPVAADNPWTSVRAGIYICLSEVNAVHARTQASGTAIVRPIQDMDYGAREYSARDAGGHLWSFGTYMMGTSDAPSGLFVDLHYDNARGAVSELERAFGFTTTLEVPGAAGAIEHAELRLGTGTLMLSGGPRQSGDAWGDDAQCTHACVSDPDAHYRHAQAAGAAIVQSPADTPYGARAYYARDPENFLWGFSTYRPKG